MLIPALAFDAVLGDGVNRVINKLDIVVIQGLQVTRIDNLFKKGRT
jgi:hypothetical protein